MKQTNRPPVKGGQGCRPVGRAGRECRREVNPGQVDQAVRRAGAAVVEVPWDLNSSWRRHFSSREALQGGPGNREDRREDRQVGCLREDRREDRRGGGREGRQGCQGCPEQGKMPTTPM